MRTFIFFILLGSSSVIFSQERLSAIFTFDDCTGMNLGNFGDTATILGNIPCECGVSGDALSLDGNNDRVIFADTLKQIFEDDFTVSFYYKLRNTSGTVDLFSYRPNCNSDSSISVRYVPLNNQLRVEIAETFNNLVNLEANPDMNKCWHQVIVSKFNLTYSLFVDGILVDQMEADSRISFDTSALIAFSNSPCLAFTEERIVGEIDEVQLHNFAFTAAEVAQSYLNPDEILNMDTTIFAGETVELMTGPTCASSIQWTPDTGLDADDIAEPTVTGVTTTTYEVTFQTGNCIASDMVTINVIDPGTLECDDLLLPKAFTPNNDGINDIYKISNDFIVQSLTSFEIFDRWGERVFFTNEKTDGWDGNYKGQEMNAGMFLYKITYTCENQEFIVLDNFTVLR